MLRYEGELKWGRERESLESGSIRLAQCISPSLIFSEKLAVQVYRRGLMRISAGRQTKKKETN